MRNDYEVAQKFRYQGKSYGEISKILGIPKSTLSFWFRDDARSAVFKTVNRSLVGKRHAERLKPFILARNATLTERYDAIRAEARTTFVENQFEPLFVAGLMLYAASGDLNPKTNLIRFGSFDPQTLAIFTRFVRMYLKTGDKLRFMATLSQENDVEATLTRWSEALSIDRGHFYKTQIKKRMATAVQLPFGTGTIILGSKSEKTRLLELIRLMKRQLANAGMV